MELKKKKKSIDGSPPTPSFYVNELSAEFQPNSQSVLKKKKEEAEGQDIMIHPRARGGGIIEGGRAGKKSETRGERRGGDGVPPLSTFTRR